jgi:phosphatidate phosphatase APP1
VPHAKGTSWRDRLGQIAGELRGELERAGHFIGLDRHDERRFEIAGYRGFGTRARVLVHGRVIESRNIPAPSATDSLWRNLLSTYKRIDADPLGGARVIAHVGGVEHELVADDEGFFRQWIEVELALGDHEHWHDVELRLASPLHQGHPEVKSTASIRVPGGAATFGVISDLDDTVIQSRRWIGPFGIRCTSMKSAMMS